MRLSTKYAGIFECISKFEGFIVADFEYNITVISLGKL